MQHFELKGQVRQAAGKAAIKAFRKQGLVPCNLYGLGMENVLFTVNAKELKALTDTPKSFIVDLSLDNGTSHMAVLHEMQWHPVKDNCLHVPIVITGHAIGVQQGGKFTQGCRAIKISALMKDLPDDVTVDISKLGLDKKIKAQDIKLDKISVLTDKDAVICEVKATRNSAAAATTEEEAA